MENAVEMKDNEGLIGKIYDQWRFECGKSSIRILYQWVFFNGNIIELHGGSSIKMACLITVCFFTWRIIPLKWLIVNNK